MIAYVLYSFNSFVYQQSPTVCPVFAPKYTMPISSPCQASDYWMTFWFGHFLKKCVWEWETGKDESSFCCLMLLFWQIPMDHWCPVCDWFLNAGSFMGYMHKIFGFSLGALPSTQFTEVEKFTPARPLKYNTSKRFRMTISHEVQLTH